jgi:pimeloyl-ACP methyl ester carboxylesterase
MKTPLHSLQYRPRSRRVARAFPLVTLLFLLLSGCGRNTLYLTPPGAGEAPAGAEIHRLLFIHGFNGEVEQWDRFWLDAAASLPVEYEIYLVTGLPPLMGSMEGGGPEKSLAHLENWLEDQAIPLENLHLVAHSMGGLLARRFVTEHPGAVEQVFLLGVPSGGVRGLGGLNPKGWCTPEGIDAFNAANPPDPSVDWYVLAGNRFTDGSGGAFLEGFPNDGVVSVASVMQFVELCGDSVSVESNVMPLTHPTWNWGESLLNSRRSIQWVLARIPVGSN